MKNLFIKLAILSIFALWGCASAPTRKPNGIFFPPAPDLPRVQFLTSFSGLKDVEKQSSFNRFVAGEQGNKILDKPYGVAMYEGKIYVCDTNDTVVVLDLRNKSYTALKGATGSGRLIQPINISIESDGTKYVTDPVRGQVVVFDKNDDYVKAYGTPGNWRPVDAVPYEDRLYVADMTSGQIKVFDKQSGEIVKTIGDKGEPSERIDRPTNLAFDNEGYLYVTDIGRFQVVKFDRDGHFRNTIGKAGDNWGHFTRPKGIAIDREGHLYVADASFNNVQIFNKEGRILMFFGEGGTEAGKFLLPAKVSISYNDLQYFQRYADPSFQMEYLIFVTSQLGDRSISVLAYGKEKGKKYPTDEELKKQLQEKIKKTSG